MSRILIRSASIINEGDHFTGSILIDDGVISAIYTQDPPTMDDAAIMDASGLTLIPGVIDDQVHFRDPGLTHKADLATETRAAVAGGITSVMEMPNTIPQTTTQKLLEEKYALGAEKCLTNYSFYMGATNDNLTELLKTDPESVCGIKVFMGSSTGNMLVDDKQVLREIFAQSPVLVACHCEDEGIIRKNLQRFTRKYGDDIPVAFHPVIRNQEACFRSSSYAVSLAREFNTRLHILHLSTARELELFDSFIPPSEKQITAEVCVHHLWFNDEAYRNKGTLVKWNPAIKTEYDRSTLLAGVMNNIIDVIATDHAPHTLEEKQQPYTKAPSGGPLVQHSLPLMLEYYHKGDISLEKLIYKMCHNPASIFGIRKRGFIREGYKADLALLDLNKPWTVSEENILYKCGWSPLEGQTLRSRVVKTFVNGNLVYDDGKIYDQIKGQRLLFDR
jgi:dihydroorotase